MKRRTTSSRPACRRRIRAVAPSASRASRSRRPPAIRGRGEKVAGLGCLQQVLGHGSAPSRSPATAPRRRPRLIVVVPFVIVVRVADRPLVLVVVIVVDAWAGAMA